MKIISKYTRVGALEHEVTKWRNYYWSYGV